MLNVKGAEVVSPLISSNFDVFFFRGLFCDDLTPLTGILKVVGTEEP